MELRPVDLFVMRRLASVIVATLILGACSADEESRTSQDKDHVWKEQTQTIDKARDVGRQLGEAAARQQKAAQ